MPVSPTCRQALDELGVSWTEDAPLHKRVWWRTGGPADALVEVHTTDQLSGALAVATTCALPTFVLGNGSNLLIRDGGIRGLVFVLRGELADSVWHSDHCVLGGGLKIAVLLSRAAKRAWSGFHRLGGIPGTVGGAVRMNAGTHLGEISDLLEAVEVALPDGTTRWLPAQALGLGYRTCVLPPGAVVARARLSQDPMPYSESKALLQDHLDRRKATQPVNERTCGSTFRNPPGDYAGRLIEAAGLKGHCIGGAMVSPKHANFVVNTGTATANDLETLIRHIQATVADTFSVQLEHEVHIVGDTLGTR